MSETFFHTGVMRLMDVLKGEWRKYGYDFVGVIARNKSITQILLLGYFFLKKEGQLVPIEDLSEQERSELLLEAENQSGSKDQKQNLKIAKAIIALGTYIQD